MRPVTERSPLHDLVVRIAGVVGIALATASALLPLVVQVASTAFGDEQVYERSVVDVLLRISRALERAEPDDTGEVVLTAVACAVLLVAVLAPHAVVAIAVLRRRSGRVVSGVLGVAAAICALGVLVCVPGLDEADGLPHTGPALVALGALALWYAIVYPAVLHLGERPALTQREASGAY